MKNKFLQIEAEARNGIEKFYENIFQAENIEEMQEELNTILNLIYRYAPIKNNRQNKGLKVFQEYGKIQISRETKVRRSVSNSKIKNHWKDYEAELLILRKRNHSWRKLSELAQSKFHVKVSSETLRKHFKEYENV